MSHVTAEEVRAQLMASSQEFRRLAEQHSNHDRRIEELSSRRFPSAEEQDEEQRLKKKKLQLKDQMQQMVEDFELHPA